MSYGPRCCATTHNAPDCFETDLDPEEYCPNCHAHYEATTGAAGGVADSIAGLELRPAGVRPPLAKGDDGSANWYPSRV